MNSPKEVSISSIAKRYLLNVGVVFPFIAAGISRGINFLTNNQIINNIIFIVLGLLAIWVGIIYTARFISKRYVINDVNKLVNTATKYFIVLWLALVLLLAIYSHNFGWQFILNIISLVLKITVFYVLSLFYIRKYTYVAQTDPNFFSRKKDNIMLVIIVVLLISSAIPGVMQWNITRQYYQKLATDFMSPNSELKLKLCVVDSSCIKVKADCCPCENGGKAVAINNSSEYSWNKQLEEKCKDVVCLAPVNIQDPSCSKVPKCFNPKCELVDSAIGQLNNISAETIVDETSKLNVTTKELEKTYSFGDVVIKLDLNIDDMYTFAIAQGNKEIYSSEEFDSIDYPRMFVYNNERYFMVPAWLGGNSGSTDMYFYVINKAGVLTSVDVLGRINEYKSFNPEFSDGVSAKFYAEKNGKIYLTFQRTFNPEHRNTYNVLFQGYFRIENYKIISYTQDFQPEYLAKAQLAEKSLTNEEDSYYWSLSLIESTLNYILAGDTIPATELLKENFTKFHNNIPESSNDYLEVIDSMKFTINNQKGWY